MSLTTVESLIDDVMLEIFDFLDASSLKKCSLVCKRWNDLIGTSISTMRKLPLVFKSNWKNKDAEAKQIQRHHHTIMLDNFVYDGPELLQTVTKLGTNVRQLQLDHIIILHSSFPRFLNALPKLERIIFSECDFCNAFNETFEIKNLKTLLVLGTDLKIFDRIDRLQVEELKIAVKESTEADVDSFVKILTMQTNLTKLAMRVRQGRMIKALELVRPKLKKLSVDFHHWGSDQSVDDAFIKFLESQQSLEELETENVLSEKIVEFAMKNLKLKRLIVNGRLNNIRPAVFNSIRTNNHLKTLLINEELASHDTALGLLRVYPSVEKLVIKRWSDAIINDVIVFIANNLKCLRHLEIPSFTANTPELSIPTLKTFQVDFLEDVNQWQTFLVNNPSLETVAVQWIPNANAITYESLDVITQRLPKLTHMKFGAKFKPTQRMLEMMHRNCPQLHLLETFNNVFLEDEPKSTNTNFGTFKVIFYPHEAVTSVFKVEPTMWSVEDNFDIDLESEIDSEEDELMSWSGGEESDRESDFDYEDVDEFDYEFPQHLYPF